MQRGIAAFVLFALLAGGGIWAVRSYQKNQDRKLPIIFSNHAMLAELWNVYKINNLEAETLRTLDKQRGNITTSEGQSYTMLRAVWMDDKPTFDQSWQWTKDNLQRSDDHLFSWLFGQRPDGSYGILTEQGGANTASDADQDIALALIFAYGRWGEQRYAGDAQPVIQDIWEKEVTEINGTPYLLANNLEKTAPDKAVINPSYLAPYAYRIFAQVDPNHPWNTLVESSYSLIRTSAQSPLDKPATSGLPPDWAEIDKRNGELMAPHLPAQSTNYGYDAIRTPWRLALDWQWYHDPRDMETLEGFRFLGSQWQERQALAAVYSHDGKEVETQEAPAVYGANLSYFTVVSPQTAEEIYKQKLTILYNPDTQSWTQPLPYYDDNWAWFGMALYNRSLPNLAANIQP